MNGMFKSKSFWIVALIVALVLVFSGPTMQSGYQSEMRILAIAKSDKAAGSVNQIVENICEIPLSLSFYDFLVKKFPEINDPMAGLPAGERKAAWNQMLKTERVDGSTLVKITASHPDPVQAELVAQKTASDTAYVFSKYYDTNNDLEIRIVDGPITRQSGKVLDWTKISLGLLLGFAAGAVSYLLQTFFLNVLPGLFRRKTAVPAVTFTTASKFNEPKSIFPTIDPALRERYGKKAAAPANLPVDDFLIQPAPENNIENEPVIEDKKTHEATPEEVQRRLNKLMNKSQAATPEEVRERLNKLLRGGL